MLMIHRHEVNENVKGKIKQLFEIVPFTGRQQIVTSSYIAASVIAEVLDFCEKYE